MNRWFLDENDIDIYLKCTDDVRWHYNKKELVRILNDLEAKLAESEKKAYSRGHSQRDIANEIKLNALREDVANKEKRIVELKQQLAEKEKLIEDYSAFFNQLFNQDKISFALEQLEKVKENIKKVPITDFDLSGNFEKMYKQDAIRQIDNQINELKGEKV